MTVRTPPSTQPRPRPPPGQKHAYSDFFDLIKARTRSEVEARVDAWVRTDELLTEAFEVEVRKIVLSQDDLAAFSDADVKNLFSQINWQKVKNVAEALELKIPDGVTGGHPYEHEIKDYGAFKKILMELMGRISGFDLGSVAASGDISLRLRPGAGSNVVDRKGDNVLFGDGSHVGDPFKSAKIKNFIDMNLRTLRSSSDLKTIVRTKKLLETVTRMFYSELSREVRRAILDNPSLDKASAELLAETLGNEDDRKNFIRRHVNGAVLSIFGMNKEGFTTLASFFDPSYVKDLKNKAISLISDLKDTGVMDDLDSDPIVGILFKFLDSLPGVGEGFQEVIKFVASDIRRRLEEGELGGPIQMEVINLCRNELYDGDGPIKPFLQKFEFVSGLASYDINHRLLNLLTREVTELLSDEIKKEKEDKERKDSEIKEGVAAGGDPGESATARKKRGPPKRTVLASIKSPKTALSKLTGMTWSEDMDGELAIGLIKLLDDPAWRKFRDFIKEIPDGTRITLSVVRRCDPGILPKTRDLVSVSSASMRLGYLLFEESVLSGAEGEISWTYMLRENLKNVYKLVPMEEVPNLVDKFSQLPRADQSPEIFGFLLAKVLDGGLFNNDKRFYLAKIYNTINGNVGLLGELRPFLNHLMDETGLDQFSVDLKNGLVANSLAAFGPWNDRSLINALPENYTETKFLFAVKAGDFEYAAEILRMAPPSGKSEKIFGGVRGGDWMGTRFLEGLFNSNGSPSFSEIAAYKPLASNKSFARVLIDKVAENPKINIKSDVMREILKAAELKDDTRLAFVATYYGKSSAEYFEHSSSVGKWDEEAAYRELLTKKDSTLDKNQLKFFDIIVHERIEYVSADNLLRMPIDAALSLSENTLILCARRLKSWFEWKFQGGYQSDLKYYDLFRIFKNSEAASEIVIATYNIVTYQVKHLVKHLNPDAVKKSIGRLLSIIEKTDAEVYALSKIVEINKLGADDDFYGKIKSKPTFIAARIMSGDSDISEKEWARLFASYPAKTAVKTLAYHCLENGKLRLAKQIMALGQSFGVNVVHAFAENIAYKISLKEILNIAQNDDRAETYLDVLGKMEELKISVPTPYFLREVSAGSLFEPSFSKKAVANLKNLLASYPNKEVNEYVFGLKKAMTIKLSAVLRGDDATARDAVQVWAEAFDIVEDVKNHKPGEQM